MSCNIVVGVVYFWLTISSARGATCNGCVYECWPISVVNLLHVEVTEIASCLKLSKLERPPFSIWSPSTATTTAQVLTTDPFHPTNDYGQPVVVLLAVFVGRDNSNPRQIHPQTAATHPDRHPQPHQRISAHSTIFVNVGRAQTAQASPFYPPAAYYRLPVLVC